MREGGKVDRKGRKGEKERKGVSIETAYHEILAERVASLNLLCLSACAIRASYLGDVGDHIFARKLFERAKIK